MNSNNSTVFVRDSNIKAGHDVIMGGHITIVNLQEAAEYKVLKANLEELEVRYEKTKKWTEQYPGDEDFQSELGEIAAQKNSVKAKIRALKEAVLKLAESFSAMPLHSERIQLAKQFFEKGQFQEARNVLDADEMKAELDALKNEEARLNQKLADNAQKRIDKANEFLMLAKMNYLNFALVNRYETILSYFKLSLEASTNEVNSYELADFYHWHHQPEEALPLYQEAIAIRRKLAVENPKIQLPELAFLLCRIGLIWQQLNDFVAAEKAFLESISILREPVETHTEANLARLADSLCNLGLLYQSVKRVHEAERLLQEALHIRRKLAKSDANLLNPLADMLNNLGVMRYEEKRFKEAKDFFMEAYEVYKQCEILQVGDYPIGAARTTNNLGAVYYCFKQYPDAKKFWRKALEIYTDLAHDNPIIFSRNLAETKVNLQRLPATLRD